MTRMLTSTSTRAQFEKMSVNIKVRQENLLQMDRRAGYSCGQNNKAIGRVRKIISYNEFERTTCDCIVWVKEHPELAHTRQYIVISILLCPLLYICRVRWLRVITVDCIRCTSRRRSADWMIAEICSLCLADAPKSRQFRGMPLRIFMSGPKSPNNQVNKFMVVINI